MSVAKLVSKIGLIFLALFCASQTLLAHELSFKHIQIYHPIIPIVGNNMDAAAGYMKITNTSEIPEKIVGIHTNVSNAMIHKSSVDSNGVARMTHLEEIFIPGNSSVTFENGGLHVMFVDLKRELEPFDDQNVTIVFERAGEVTVSFMVEEMNGEMILNMGHDKDH